MKIHPIFQKEILFSALLWMGIVSEGYSQAVINFQGNAIILMGTVHSEGNQLMDDPTRKAFSQYVVPQLKKDDSKFDRSRTILLAEGPVYIGNKAVYGKFDVSPKGIDLKPVIPDKEEYFLDPINFMPREAVVQIGKIFFADYRRVEECNFDRVFMPKYFSVFDEDQKQGVKYFKKEYVNLIDLLVNIPFTFKISETQKKDFVEKAKRFAKCNKNFEASFIHFAHQWVNDGYRVIMAVGVAHALRMYQLYAPFNRDLFIPYGMKVAPVVARQYTLLEHVALGKERNSSWYNWKNFSFSNISTRFSNPLRGPYSAPIQ